MAADVDADADEEDDDDDDVGFVDDAVAAAREDKPMKGAWDRWRLLLLLLLLLLSNCRWWLFANGTCFLMMFGEMEVDKGDDRGVGVDDDDEEEEGDVVSWFDEETADDDEEADMSWEARAAAAVIGGK